MMLDVPLKGQLLDSSEVNKYWDCVPTSIASAVQFLTNLEMDGGAMKDSVYGAGYVGGTAAIRFVDYCARFGVRLSVINGSGQSLVTDVCSQIARGNPVLLTEPDPYDDPRIYSHVILACGYDNTFVYAMDPYINSIVKKTRDEWASTLEFGQVWPLAKIGMENSVFTENSSDFARYYDKVDDHHWKCKANSFIVQLGIKLFYQGLSLDGQTLPILGLPQSNEYEVVIAGKKITVQRYERGDVAYDPAHLVDSQPGCGAEYLLKTGLLPKIH